MKFGKSIGSQQDENANSHYVDYKLLKRKIKDVVEQLHGKELDKALRANSDFDAELEAEIERVNACFGRRQMQLLEQTSSLSEELQASEASFACAADEAGGVASQRPEALRQLVTILGEVDQLRKYAVWNAVAVVKILKKRRKQTHFGLEDTAAERAAWLSRQSFFSGSDFAELHAAVESLGHMLVLSKLSPQDGAPARRPQRQIEREPQQCPICLDAISDMVELSCNHRFCWKCFVLGPIAFQPGEYRITQCPICRTDTTPSLPSCGSSQPSAAIGGCMHNSEGLLTRFLHTYFPKATEEALEEEARQEGENEREMRDVVSELVKALLADHTLQRPGKGSGSEPEEAGAGESSCSAAPNDFFQTLPRKAAQEGQQLGAAQKLQWLQLASTGDSFALDGTMYCSLCSEPLLMEAVVTTPCKHHFHRVCISRIEEPKCPLCSFDLPFSWFVPAEHPCVDKGFRVVKMKDYRPLFAGGPSRGSYGYPLHKPPPVSLCGPGGLTMKSYLHRIIPMGTDEDEEDSEPAAASNSPAPRQAEERAENSSASESSSEDSASDDGEHEHEDGERALGGAAKRSRQHCWAYSSLGRMRLLEPCDQDGERPAQLLPRPHSAGSSAAASSRGRERDPASGSAAGPVADGDPTVLFLGRHL